MSKKIEIVPTSEKTIKEVVVNAINEMQADIRSDDYPYQKLLVTFKNPVSIMHAANKTKKETKIALSFFTSASNALCYSCRSHPRHGYHVTLDMLDNMESIEIFTEDEMCSEKKVRQFVGKFHPNLWQNIVNELNADPTLMKTKYYGNFATTSITSKFPKFVLTELKNAIENRKDYSYNTYGTKRDLSVQTKLCEDGIFRAWFSSEFSGCGNGTYYLLINPTTAAFKEDD